MNHFTLLKEFEVDEPILMKFSDVCSILDVTDKHLYKLLSKKKMIYVRFQRGIRIPRPFFAAFLIEGTNSNRTKLFIEKVYKATLSEYPKRIPLTEVCEILNISKSTGKRIIKEPEISAIHYHDTSLIYVKKNDLIEYLLNHTVYK